MDRLLGFGVALISFGVLFALFSYLILLSVPLTALGLASMILGATIALTPPAPLPNISVRAMVEGGIVSVEALLEEFSASERAIYMPKKDDRSYALIPLASNLQLDVRNLMKAPVRVVTRVDGSSILMVFPPGSEAVRFSGLSAGSSLEAGVRLVLVDFVEGAESVKVVREGARIVVEVVNPMVRTGLPRFNKVMGSLATSIVGCALASILGSPVAFKTEKIEGRRVRAEFEVVK